MAGREPLQHQMVVGANRIHARDSSVRVEASPAYSQRTLARLRKRVLEKRGTRCSAQTGSLPRSRLQRTVAPESELRLHANQEIAWSVLTTSPLPQKEYHCR